MKISNRLIYIFTIISIISSVCLLKYITTADAIKVPWSKLSWLILQKAGNAWFTRTPTVLYSKHADIVSSGAIYFNSGKIGSHAKHVVDINNKHYSLWVWGQTNPFNWLGKISILITNPKGVDVVSKAVTHNQMVQMHSGIYGRYTVRYICNSSSKWDCWLRKDHPPTKVPYLSIINPVVDKEQQDLKTISTDKGTFCFIIPSEEHKQDNTITTSLTLAQLQKQFYDTQKDKFVQSFKNFTVGDTIHFEDTIQSIRYDSEKNETLFGFKDADNQIIEWPFKGDITDKYNSGMNLKLTFHVVGKEGALENIDYIQYGIDHDGQAPNINEFQE